jgi:FKBP-type peptidyl-prolyl cis-trans isomerase SlyD
MNRFVNPRIIASVLALAIGLLMPHLSWAVSDAAVAEGLQVSLEYSLSLADGTKVESNVGQEPLAFVQGSHHLVPGLESAINGMKVGQKKRVEVPPDQAYGEYDADAQLKVPKHKVPTTVKMGDVLTRPSDRKPMRVVEITNDTVVLDMNHPLAGKALVFDVKILKIERASGKP